MPVRTKEPPEGTVCITVLPNKTFRGTTYFQPADFDVSTEFAKATVDQGIAEWNIAMMTPAQLNNWYEITIGYRPQIDDPNMSDDELRALCQSVLEEQANQ